MSFKRTAALAASLVFGLGAVAGDNPAAQPTWISISGRLMEMGDDSFVVDYGEGEITVTLRAEDRDGEGYKMLRGDRVTLSGRVDKTLFADTTLTASSIFVEDVGTYFFADRDSRAVPVEMPTPLNTTVLHGTISAIGEHTFDLGEGPRRVTVNVGEMLRNPLDDNGYQHLEQGDEVRVTGFLDPDLFENHTFEARTVTTLVNR